MSEPLYRVAATTASVDDIVCNNVCTSAATLYNLHTNNSHLDSIWPAAGTAAASVPCLFGLHSGSDGSHPLENLSNSALLA